MKNAVQLIAIVALLLTFVGSASAETCNLTEKNDGSYDYDVNVQMIVNPSEKTIEFELLKPVEGSSPVGSLKTIYINLDSELIASTIVGSREIAEVIDDRDLAGTHDVDWVVEEGGNNAAGFGTFLSSVDRYPGDQDTIQYVKIQLTDAWEGTIPSNGYVTYNSNGDVLSGPYKVAVHVTRLPADRSGDTSIWVACGSNNQEIPEFPTIALPMAAIIGLAFIFGRRK